MTLQDAYDGLTRAKDTQATIRETIKDSQESCKPLASAQEDYDAARDARRAELDQWKAANESLLQKLDEAKAAVREAATPKPRRLPSSASRISSSPWPKAGLSLASISAGGPTQPSRSSPLWKRWRRAWEAL